MKCRRCNGDGYTDESTLTTPIYCECPAGQHEATRAFLGGDWRAWSRAIRGGDIIVSHTPSDDGYTTYEAWEKVNVELLGQRGVLFTHHETRTFDDETYGRIGTRHYTNDTGPRSERFAMRQAEYSVAYGVMYDHDGTLERYDPSEENGRVRVWTADLP